MNIWWSCCRHNWGRPHRDTCQITWEYHGHYQRPGTYQFLDMEPLTSEASLPCLVRILTCQIYIIYWQTEVMILLFNVGSNCRKTFIFYFAVVIATSSAVWTTLGYYQNLYLIAPAVKGHNTKWHHCYLISYTMYFISHLTRLLVMEGLLNLMYIRFARKLICFLAHRITRGNFCDLYMLQKPELNLDYWRSLNVFKEPLHTD